MKIGHKKFNYVQTLLSNRNENKSFIFKIFPSDIFILKSSLLKVYNFTKLNFL